MEDLNLKSVALSMARKIMENWELITGVWEDAEDLSTEVDHLKAFLDDAGKWEQSNSEQWKQFVKEIQLIVYQADDTIDKLLLKHELEKKKNIVKRCLSAPHYGKNLKDFAVDIKAIIKKVKKMIQENQECFEKKPMLDYQQKIIAQGSQSSLLEDDEVVGFDDEVREVTERLVKGTKNLDVIPVVGLPGLGKTTLVTKIYNEVGSSKDNGFYKRIWVHVGPDYKQKEVLVNILKKYEKYSEQYFQRMDDNELLEKIREYISKGSKCLIVLDNVWETNVLDLVRKVFPKRKRKEREEVKEEGGHRILITTREKPVGRYASDKPHYLKFLDEKESFELLVKRVFGSNKCPKDFKKPGDCIVKQCGGLPLALVVVAGALRGLSNKKEWKMISDNVEKHLIDKEDPESCLKYVEMSYDRLAKEMRPCFLYCAAFPRGFEIPAWRLIRLWIAEGLINSELEGSLEDIAEHFLNQLVDKNLLMIIEKRADGRQVKTCRLHDMLHQFCKVEATNQGLFQQVSDLINISSSHQSSATYSRRLCIDQIPLLKDVFSKQLGNFEHVRSVLCFSKDKNVHLDKIPPFPEASPLIRVLEFEPFSYFFKSDFENLFYFMRYIAISTECSFPLFFSKFENLQTLIFNAPVGPTIDIKSDIWNMLQLRHLHTNFPAMLPSPPASPSGDQESSPSCLQTLSRVTPGSCTKDVLTRACNLIKLTVQGEMTEFFDTNTGKFKNFEKLKCLEKLKLLDVSRSKVPTPQIPPTFLNFLRKLKKLTLSNTKFAWSDANSLGELQCLEILKLKENAFSGTTWDSVGFTELKVLWIDSADIKTWTASNSPFPTLERLVLKSCADLEAIPVEFVCVSSLQEITLKSTNCKASISAQTIRDSKREIYQNNQKAAESEIGSNTQATESFRFTLHIS
ncbi:hypothetical protein HAX54_009981 [Datura stramonium]|uniref:Uncharacterized protein n=1 Tax=Datura stramonium TaxID=4076 RepID=A0ABS8TFK2_DATST|nr:hypothetical protein [Datura stramonium]